MRTLAAIDRDLRANRAEARALPADHPDQAGLAIELDALLEERHTMRPLRPSQVLAQTPVCR